MNKVKLVTLFALLGSTEAATPTSVKTATYPIFETNYTAPTNNATARSGTNTDANKGGYSCIRGGYIYVHPQKIAANVPSADATIKTFYGTAAADNGTADTEFSCCFVEKGLAAAGAEDCKAAIAGAAATG